MEQIEMKVLIDVDGNECLYVEGKAWKGTGENTVYVCDLVAESGGRPIALSHVFVCRPARTEDGLAVWVSWPPLLDDAMDWER